LLFLAPLGLAMVTSACGDDEAESETSANVATGIGGSVWLLDDSSIDVDVPDGMEPITLAFTTDGSAAGHAGCNNYTAEYTVTDDGGLTFSEPAVTRMMCEDAVMAVEAAYLGELVQVTSYEIDGERLSLSGADGELLRYQADSEAMDIPDIVGDSVDDATATLEDADMTLRVVKRDGEDLAVTADFVENRVNVAVETQDDGTEVVTEIVSTG
jgi:heat shock protein HslJ